MSPILGLLLAAFATAILVWFVDHRKVPSPFSWIIYAIVAVAWTIVVLELLGFQTGMRVG